MVSASRRRISGSVSLTCMRCYGENRQHCGSICGRAPRHEGLPSTAKSPSARSRTDSDCGTDSTRSMSAMQVGGRGF